MIKKSTLKRLLARYPGDQKYWERRYKTGGTSGAGSYGRLAQFKATSLNCLFKKHDIKTIVDLGCGDGNQISLISDAITYHGFDVSHEAVRLCKSRFSSRAHWHFQQFNSDDILRVGAQGAMSLDVLFHLTKRSTYKAYIKLLFSSASHVVIIYSHFVPYEDNMHVIDRSIIEDISNLVPSWRLDETIPNKYPWDPNKPDSTSRSQFFVFLPVKS